MGEMWMIVTHLMPSASNAADLAQVQAAGDDFGERHFADNTFIPRDGLTVTVANADAVGPARLPCLFAGNPIPPIAAMMVVAPDEVTFGDMHVAVLDRSPPEGIAEVRLTAYHFAPEPGPKPRFSRQICC